MLAFLIAVWRYHPKWHNPQFSIAPRWRCAIQLLSDSSFFMVVSFPLGTPALTPPGSFISTLDGSTAPESCLETKCACEHRFHLISCSLRTLCGLRGSGRALCGACWILARARAISRARRPPNLVCVFRSVLPMSYMRSTALTTHTSSPGPGVNLEVRVIGHRRASGLSFLGLRGARRPEFLCYDSTHGHSTIPVDRRGASR